VDARLVKPAEAEKLPGCRGTHPAPEAEMREVSREACNVLVRGGAMGAKANMPRNEQPRRRRGTIEHVHAIVRPEDIL
jgi:hypothetical protein